MVVRLESTLSKFINLLFQRTDAKIRQDFENCKHFPFRALFYNSSYVLLGENAHFYEKCTFLLGGKGTMSDVMICDIKKYFPKSLVFSEESRTFAAQLTKQGNYGGKQSK